MSADLLSIYFGGFFFFAGSCSEVRTFLATVSKSVGRPRGSASAASIIAVDSLGVNSMRAYSTDCHGCGGRMENKVGGGGGGVRFRCQQRFDV